MDDKNGPGANRLEYATADESAKGEGRSWRMAQFYILMAFGGLVMLLGAAMMNEVIGAGLMVCGACLIACGVLVRMGLVKRLK